MAGKTAILSLKIIGDATGAQKAAATAKKDISGLESAVATAGKGITKASGAVGLLAGGGLALGFAKAIETDGSNRKMAASLGLDPAEAASMGALSGKLYANAYGGSLEEVNAAVGGVKSTLSEFGQISDETLERLSKKALDTAAAFPELGNATSTAGVLMKTGLAKDADEAFDLIVGSAQKMPAAMQAELLPVMDEYSKHFADLGIDGTTAFGIMAEASKGGAIQMDKTGDALKEFTIRATDGSKATADAYKAIGLNAEDMAGKIAAGGPAAHDAFAKTVAGLQAIKDPAAQAQAAIGLFGTPLEDLGTAKIPDFLGAIDPMGDSFDSLAGKATEMGDTLNSGPGSALTTLQRTAETSFTGMLAAALPVLMPILGWLQQYAPVVGPLALGIAGLAATVWIVNGAMTAWTAALAIGRGAVLVATGAQWLWNAALSANPIGIVILLIAALAAGVVWAYNNVGWFKDGVNEAGRIAGEVFTNIGKWVQDVISWLDKTLEPVGGIQGALDLMGAAGKIALDGIIGGLQSVIGWVQDAVGWFGSLFGAKDKAASVDVGGADSGGFGMALATAGPAAPAPMAGMFGATLAAPSAPAPVGMFGASYGTTAASLAGAVESASGSGDTYVSIKLEVKADATTDTVALGRELLKSINKALAATGQRKLATL